MASPPLTPPAPARGSGRSRLWPKRWLRLQCGLLLALLLPWSGLPAAEGPVLERPSRVEAAFLRNFARYVSWPAAAFPSEHAPWSVCILGSDAFDEVLEQTLQGRSEQGRGFDIYRAGALEHLPACHIVFVGHQNVAKRRAALEELKKLPVLTVGHAPDFLHEGGVIRLRVGERVEMSVNLDQARAVSLGIPAKMLEVSRDVLDNGVLRRWR